MTKRDWMSVGLKCAFLAVFLRLFYYTIYYSMLLVSDIAAGANIRIPLADTLGLAVGCVVVFVALRYSDALAAQACPDERPWMPDERTRFAFLLACRIAGAFFVFTTAVTAFLRIAYWLGAWPGEAVGGPANFYAGYAVRWAVEFGLAFYLLFGGKGLVRLAFAGEDRCFGSLSPDGEILGIGRPREIFSLAVRIIGLVCLLSRLPTIVNDLVLLILPILHEAGARSPGKAGFLWSLGMVAVCIYLITGAKHLVALVFRREPKERPA